MNIMQHAYIWYRRCECVERKGRKLSAMNNLLMYMSIMQQ